MVQISTQVNELEIDDFQGKVTQNIVLSQVSWQTFKALLADMGNHRSSRLTYNQGTLQIKMPSKLHEIINRLLARIVTTLTEELGLNVIDLGSTTLEREDLAQGAEPDTCFYIQNADLLTGLDPEIPENLPPDLVIEVDITSPSTRRIDVYQALGIPEVWCYTKKQGLKVYLLRGEGENQRYEESAVSGAFSLVTAEVLNQFLQQRQTMNENTVIRSVRDWVKLNIAQN
ncbi:Uma2 family endonuclease [Aerosakkonemataceae cyanobacterium BLCC-F50]|uniref:Uma2 family endonuclease n=1 Tax=Floridaenema flaviceps BLCC-F50 TaxID=3153642 RepID=A0ABV4XSL4_9CYAN